MGRSPSCDENGVKKGPWTPEEDRQLIEHIGRNGHASWRALPKLAGLKRCGKSCRLRWTNYLRPDIKRGNFSEDEHKLIINLHATLGNKWSIIAGHLPGRTDNEIKNLWNTHLKKKLLRMGIDPVTHRPRTDLTDTFADLIAAANFATAFLAATDPAQQMPKIQVLLRLLGCTDTTSSVNMASSEPNAFLALQGSTTDDPPLMLNSPCTSKIRSSVSHFEGNATLINVPTSCPNSQSSTPDSVKPLSSCYTLSQHTLVNPTDNHGINGCNATSTDDLIEGCSWEYLMDDEATDHFQYYNWNHIN